MRPACAETHLMDENASPTPPVKHCPPFSFHPTLVRTRSPDSAMLRTWAFAEILINISRPFLYSGRGVLRTLLHLFLFRTKKLSIVMISHSKTQFFSNFAQRLPKLTQVEESSVFTRSAPEHETRQENASHHVIYKFWKSYSIWIQISGDVTRKPSKN